ncbi:hypothetical protein B0H63DRAFT_103082 [Podospora didyma]|uniref:Uncharacterized protein n=1 Tax=Podospora didyma TaxID=330526 RepID=A0AAE0NXZ4_9PEZI|nr:hypothetical protein B0H63DRAFT_103082 [Podospora didyma]
MGGEYTSLSLLLEKGRSSPSPSTGQNETRKGSFNLIRTYILLLHVLLLGLIAVLWDGNNQDPCSPSTKGGSWSPVQESIDYGIISENSLGSHKFSRYSGPPTDDQEEAWYQLVRPVFFSATYEEMSKAGESFENATKVADGGYLAALGVYHELHCIRRLRMYLYQSHYYPNLTDAQAKYLEGHLDHCLETLRLTIMCHGNSAMASFTWSDTNSRKPVARSNSRSFCVKWSTIEEWSYSRMLPITPSFRGPGAMVA